MVGAGTMDGQHFSDGERTIVQKICCCFFLAERSVPRNLADLALACNRSHGQITISRKSCTASRSVNSAMSRRILITSSVHCTYLPYLKRVKLDNRKIPLGRDF